MFDLFRNRHCHINLQIKKRFMEKELNSLEKETYIAPDIEVVEIEIEQNILQGGSGDVPDMGPVDW